MSSSESFFHSFRYCSNSSSGSAAIVDKEATCTAPELRRPAVTGERASSGMCDESDTMQMQETGNDLPRSQLSSSRFVRHDLVEVEERPYLHGSSSAARDISEAGTCVVGCIGDTVSKNLQSIGDYAMIGDACVLVGGNEDITCSSNHVITTIDQAATTVAPSKLTTKRRKVTERPAAAERVSRPSKRTKIESEFDKLTALEQTMFIRSKQQQQQSLFLHSSATGLSARPSDSSCCLELRQRELCELRRELSSVLSIGAEVRSRESKLKRAISRLQKEVASCLEPVQCAKEPAEPVGGPLAQLFPVPKHGSVDAQQRCFKEADQKAGPIMWTLAHQSEDMLAFNAVVVSDGRCGDSVRGFKLSIGGSDTNDSVGAPGIQVTHCSSSSSSSSSYVVDDGTTSSQDLRNDVEVITCQEGAHTSIVPSDNLASSQSMDPSGATVAGEAEVDALCCDGDQATSSIIVELGVTIKSHSSVISSMSPLRGGALQVVDLTVDTPQPAVRHVGRNAAAGN